jgi:hypothetical protein
MNEGRREPLPNIPAYLQVPPKPESRTNPKPAPPSSEKSIKSGGNDQ